MVASHVAPPSRRFLGVRTAEMPQWAPFGDDGRSCVGMKLAVEEAKVYGNVVPSHRVLATSQGRVWAGQGSG